MSHPQCPVWQLGMDLDGEESIQEDDEDKMGWQESTKDPGWSCELGILPAPLDSLQANIEPILYSAPRPPREGLQSP